MAEVSTSLTKPSHVIKYEEGREWARSRSKYTAVLMTAAREVGEVLYYDTANSRWTTPTTDTTSGLFGILADPEVYDVLEANYASDYTVDLNVVDKDATVVASHLVYDSGLDSDDKTVFQGLMEDQGIQFIGAVNTPDAE